LQPPDPTTMAAHWRATELIQQLQLLPHPEGGHYRETHRAALQIQTPWGLRAVSTAILYLLQNGERSCWHRIRSDEAWHHHGGGGLVIYAIGPDGTAREHRLGLDLASGQQPQRVVPAGSWFAATPAPGSPWCLVSCTVAPGFDFADFELARPEHLQTRQEALAASCPHWRRFLA